MKTFLVNPPYTLAARYGKKMAAFGGNAEPLGLAYLASSLLAAGFEVEIIDAPVSGLDAEQTVARIRQGGGTLVGMFMTTTMFDVVADMCRRLRAAMPDCRIIVGGPHPTALPIRTLEEIPELDFCCAGEGEDLMVELAQALSSGGSYADIAGLAYRVDGGGAKANPPRPFNRDLDRLPPPARHLLPMSEYTLTATRTQGSRFCPTFIVARGCPYTCSFCAHPIGLAHRSIPNVIAEIREVVAAYDTDQINIEADTLTANRKFVTELCNALIEADLGVRWTCGARVDRMDEDILRLMKKAGCWQASYGVETGSQRLLEQITKGITKDRIRETFRLTKKVGIKPRAFFMINLPGETLEETYETIRFAQELDPLWANFTITIPYPGTPMYDELLRAGKIRHFRWSEYNTWSGFSDYELPFVNDGRTEAEIKAMQKKALKMFYMRPAPAMRFLRSITTLNDVKKYARGLVTLLAS